MSKLQFQCFICILDSCSYLYQENSAVEVKTHAPRYWRVTEGCMGYKMASVTFWVPHTTLEKKFKCTKNNPNHKPNVPLVTEEKPLFDPFVQTILPHIGGKTGRFTLYFTLLLFTSRCCSFFSTRCHWLL
jgi:hypothetical protein